MADGDDVDTRIRAVFLLMARSRRAQPMTMASILLTEGAVFYLEQDGDGDEGALFLERLTDPRERAGQLDQAHELFQQAA